MVDIDKEWAEYARRHHFGEKALDTSEIRILLQMLAMKLQAQRDEEGE